MKPKAKPPSRSDSRLAVIGPWLAVAAVILFVAVVRIRLMHLPLERDEGEYAFAGQLMLRGVPPYREAFNMKFPGTYAAYAMLMAVFGQTIEGIRLGFLVWNAATIVLIFLVGRRLLGAAAGVACGAAYGVLSMGVGVYGLEAHATHFVILPAVAGCLLLLRFADTGSHRILFISGVLFGAAILMKQHGVFLAAFAAAYLLWQSWPEAMRKRATFFAGVCAPLALTGITLWMAGVFGRFWFWTFTYAREYVTIRTLSDGVGALANIFPHVVGPNLLIWIFAAAGLLLIWRKREDRRTAVFLSALLAFSFLAMCPGLYFTNHYFVLILPAVALLAGAAFRSLQGLAGSGIAIALFAAGLAFPIYQQSDVFFRLTSVEIIHRLYGINPFHDAVEVAGYIRNHTAEGERIAVLGSEPEIYFYARRGSVTGYIYTYALMEPQPFAVQMQDEMIGDIERGRPRFVVLATVEATWDMFPTSSHHIFQWWDAYSTQHYRKVGVAEVTPSRESEYHWGDLEGYQPKADVTLVVYQRKD